MTLTNLFTWRPFPFAYMALYLTLILTPMIIKPSTYRRWFFMPLLLLTWRLVHDAQAGYVTSTFWLTCLLMASDYILVTDVQRTLTQLPGAADGSPGERQDATRKIGNMSLPGRITWALTLFFNTRGVGWAHEPRGALPPRAPPNTPRLKFIARQLACFCLTLLLFDLVNLHVRWNPAFRFRTGLAAEGLTWRIIGTVGWAAGAAAGLTLPHYAASIVCVALGISRPQDWPPLFGSLADAASVRTFWARGWHQIIRRSLCAHGNYAAHTLLRLPHGSAAASCVQISIAFALSGVLHYLGETIAIGPGRSGSLLFFGIQPAAIALETLVASLRGKARGRAPGGKALGLGHVWVLAWFTLTLPIMQDPLIKAGELASRVDVSLIMRVWRGTWTLPPV
ncbi:membrane bound O-acyl transferase family-domain-containing protein [Mycena vulgaris]|nr:membrane bound O-acyl transferase family-domain-containing protein [Mycena vulgaris]